MTPVSLSSFKRQVFACLGQLIAAFKLLIGRGLPNFRKKGKRLPVFINKKERNCRYKHSDKKNASLARILFCAATITKSMISQVGVMHSLARASLFPFAEELEISQALRLQLQNRRPGFLISLQT